MSETLSSTRYWKIMLYYLVFLLMINFHPTLQGCRCISKQQKVICSRTFLVKSLNSMEKDCYGFNDLVFRNILFCPKISDSDWTNILDSVQHLRLDSKICDCICVPKDVQFIMRGKCIPRICEAQR